MIRLIRPYISFSEISKEIEEIMDSGILTSGKYSKKLPEVITEYTGAKYAFNTTSATTALAMALEVLNISSDDEVIVSDFSFPASANVIEQRGAKVVFADVDRNTYNTMPAEIEKKLTDKTKAVIFVCALGNPTGADDVWNLCKKRGIPLIVDAACALGSSIGKDRIGNIGDISCFSFHPRKLITSGEGGMITTSNPEFAGILDVKLRHGSIPENGKMKFVDYGFNYRLPEIQSLMLIKQLNKIDEIISERIEIQKYYADELADVGFRAQIHADICVHNMQSVVFKMPKSDCRDDLISFLRDKEIETVMGTYCISGCDYYRRKYDDVQPNSLWLENNTICLPCYHNVEKEYVVEAIKDYFNSHGRQND